MMWLLTVKLCLTVVGDAQCAAYQRHFTDQGDCYKTGKAMVEWLNENADVPRGTSQAAFKCLRGRDA